MRIGGRVEGYELITKYHEKRRFIYIRCLLPSARRETPMSFLRVEFFGTRNKKKGVYFSCKSGCEERFCDANI